MEMLKIGKLKEIQVNCYNPNDSIDSNIVFSGSLDTNRYDDITSNKNWFEIGRNTYDYIFCRNQIMTRTSVIGFSGLTQTEKEYASRVYAVGPTERNEVHSENEQENNWGEFVNNMVVSRYNRWTAAKNWIGFKLETSDSIDLAKSTDSLSEEYKKYGIENNASDGTDGLFDWLENTSSYSGGTGFSGKTYWTQEYQDKLMDILRNGNY